MTIENGRLVAGPVKRRDFEKQFYISYISSAEPGTARKYVDSDGNLASDDQLPQVEGQIAVWKKGNGDQLAHAYVAVSVSGALKWVKVIHTLDVLDTRTDASWDPLASFYNPLAS